MSYHKIFIMYGHKPNHVKTPDMYDFEKFGPILNVTMAVNLHHPSRKCGALHRRRVVIHYGGHFFVLGEA